MFTGIVEDIGTVVSFAVAPPSSAPANEWTKDGWVLVIAPSRPALFADDSTYIGASVCVSGVCLTVTAFDARTLTFGVAPETIRRTNFASLKKGTKVNLERAALASSRNSGHYVQGHVDGVATVLSKHIEGDSLWFKFSLADEFLKYVAPKGFVAVEGTSLTVVDVNRAEHWFTLMLIEHTQKHIVLPLRAAGDAVNVEVDVNAKFAEQGLAEVNSRLAALEQRMAKLEGRL